MKNLTLALILSCLAFTVSAQTNAKKFKAEALRSQGFSTKEQKPKLLKYNFSELFTHTDNSMVFGFIGANYQRLKIKIISIKKDSARADVYHVYGKSMVKNNIDEFTGIITISTIRSVSQMSYGLDDELKNKGLKGEYAIIGDYTFTEDVYQPHSGVFEGSFKTRFYVDKNNIVHYDDIENYSDRYSNNEFVGIWTSHDKKPSKICNWGDYRIPDSGDFDIGAGEFSPSDEYLKYGWQTVRYQWALDQRSVSKAKKAENAKWWL